MRRSLVLLSILVLMAAGNDGEKIVDNPRKQARERLRREENEKDKLLLEELSKLSGEEKETRLNQIHEDKERER